MNTEGPRPSLVGLPLPLAVGSIVLLTLAVPLAAVAHASESRWTVEPGVRIGVITTQTAEMNLIGLLGRRNVRRAGQSTRGTAVPSLATASASSFALGRR